MDEILDEWNIVEGGGLPLKHTSSLLVTFEFIDFKRGILNSLPWPWHLIKMIELVRHVRPIAFGEMRINKLSTVIKRILLFIESNDKPTGRMAIIRRYFDHLDALHLDYLNGRHHLFQEYTFSFILPSVYNTDSPELMRMWYPELDSEGRTLSIQLTFLNNLKGVMQSTHNRINMASHH